MSANPYLGEISMFAGNFAPRDWAFCNGQLLPINSYSALFSLLGTYYGGDGRTTFGLPNLQGRVPIHVGGVTGQGPGLSRYRLGEKGGQETHTLLIPEMPSHSHLTTNTPGADQHILLSTTAGVRDTPIAGDVPAASSFGVGLGATKVNAFGPPNNTVNGQAISANAGLTINNNGSSQPHNNIQPFQGINYIIALQGIFPSRS